MDIFDFYFENYRKLLVIPMVVFVLASGVLINNKLSTGSFVIKDISLKGGTLVTFRTQEKIQDFESKIADLFGTDDIVIRELEDTLSQKFIGYEIQIGLELERDDVFSKISDVTGFELDESNSNFGLQSSLLATSFFKDSLSVFAIAFFLITFVMIYYFKSPIPALSIAFSTFADVVGIAAVMSLFGVKFGIPTIGALLMITGFSTDSDVLLATYMLKRRDSHLKTRMKQAIKTEITMELAAYVSFGVMFIFSNVAVIKHIALVLLLGNFFDSMNTWILSAGLQRMYVERVEK